MGFEVLFRSKSSRIRTTSCSSRVKLLEHKMPTLEPDFQEKQKFRRQSCEGTLFGKVDKEKRMISSYPIEVKQHRRSRLQTIFRTGSKVVPRPLQHRRATITNKILEISNKFLKPFIQLEQNVAFQGRSKKPQKKTICHKHIVEPHNNKAQLHQELSNFKDSISSRFHSLNQINYPQTDELKDTVEEPKIKNSSRLKKIRIRTPPTELVKYQKYLYGMSKSQKNIPQPILGNSMTSQKSSISYFPLDQSYHQTSLKCIVQNNVQKELPLYAKVITRSAFRIKNGSLCSRSPSISIYKH